MLQALTQALRTRKPNAMSRVSQRGFADSAASAGSTQPFIKLHNGLLMPQLGLGTWQSAPNVVREAVKSAMRVGYRHFDCASIYENEREVGQGLKEGMAELGLKREDIWVTSKLWNTSHRPDLVKVACEQTLHDLGLDYLDMYLMHWPVDQIPEEGPKVGGDPTATETPLWETFDAMNELVTDGLTRAIGVSNFSVQELEELIKDTDIIPTVNQIEMHPYLIQPKLLDYCSTKGIAITAYCPLGRAKAPRGVGLPPLLEHPVLKTISEKRGKTPAQIALRWAIQRDTIVIPKSTNAGRIKENWEIFDFILDEEDMEHLNALNKHYRFVRPSFHDFKDDIEGDGRL
jgi:alcohol dehydrogenase (NADP+)